MEHKSNETPPGNRTSNRTFGLVFASICGCFAVYPLIFGASFRPGWAVAAGAFLVSGLFAPAVLAPFNQAWFRLGLVMHRVVNPVVMGVIFIVAVLPTGILMRLAGKDPMRLRRDPAARTYWIDRTPPATGTDSMKNQF